MKEKGKLISKSNKVVFTLIIIATVLLVIAWPGLQTVFGNNDFKTAKQRKEKNLNNATVNRGQAEQVKVIAKWDMPAELKEISGISFINENRFACIQDELATVYIFNTTSGKIEKEISFGGAGDYEGIAVVGNDIYVGRSDGKIFEVAGYNNSKPVITAYSTHLKAKNNVEGLCYDKKNKRLLLAVKGKDAGNNAFKGLYGFDLASKNLAVDPVYKIDLKDPVWNEVKGKNKLQPSDVAIHPGNGDIYIIDGASPKLLVLGPDAVTKNLYFLTGSEFSQPEGISFSPSGELFISNEGVTKAGNILKVSLP